MIEIIQVVFPKQPNSFKVGLQDVALARTISQLLAPPSGTLRRNFQETWRNTEQHTVSSGSRRAEERHQLPKHHAVPSLANNSSQTSSEEPLGGRPTKAHFD